MNHNEIRKAFLRFFEEREHRVFESASLIPSDSSVLFTVAGMVPFKDYFLGNKPLEFSRAVSCQRCLRTVDIDKIGKTTRHLTFFEMLGNFSFGDYFKEEAIKWGWEFLTNELSLPKDRLYVTVFKEDDEAEKIWKKFISKERIIRLGEESNFWKMGDTGPCGPCSEIIFDLGEDFSCKKPSCSIGCDCDRYLELWNLVFTEFDRQKDGSLKPLPKKNIDTGMGLERLSFVINGKKSAFDSDIISPIVEYIKSYTSHSPLSTPYYIIADHIRAISHLIYDGIIPSNVERGYILRSLIRRAIREGRKLELEGLFLHKLVVPVSQIFPYLKAEREHIANIIKFEEEKFQETIERGLNILEERIRNCKDVFPGKWLFELYDTYGFPVDYAIEIIKEYGKAIDMDEYHKMMNEQKERSRLKTSFSPGVSWNIEVSASEFVGYNTLETEAKVVFATSNNVILNRTPFYPESGGQVGDKGFLITKDGIKLVVENTQKREGLIVHQVKDNILREGDIVHAIVDKEKRKGIERAHTATHLLQASLREVLGKHIRQYGSLVENDRLRFDFTHPKKLSDSQIKETEQKIYQWIMENLEVNIQENVSKKDAIAQGALAFFEDEYGELVRVVKIGNISTELCGGCHITSTGKIGIFKITKESSVASGVRRIEGLTGLLAYEYIIKDKEDLLSKIEALKKENREKERDIERLKKEILKKDLDIPLQKIGNINFVFDVKEGLSSNELSFYIDKIANLQMAVVLLANKGKDNIIWKCKVSKDLTEKIRADYIIKEVCKITGGGGGGRADFATGGGKNPEKINEAYNFLLEFLKKIQ